MCSGGPIRLVKEYSCHYYLPEEINHSWYPSDETATYINCTLNDTLIYPNITQIILSYQLPIKILVELVFQSRDEGWYNCSVSNSRVDDKYYNDINQAYPAYNNIYVKGMSKNTHTV